MGCRCEEQFVQELATAPECIGHLWVFADLPAAELGALVQAARRQVYHKGQEIFSQGAP